MRSRLVWVVVGFVAAFVAVAAVVAVTGTSDADVPAADAVAEVQPVTVLGDALPVFTDGPDAALGVSAPVLEGLGFSGNAVSTAPGTPTMLVFLAHWCPHCQYEVPVLVRMQREGALPDVLDVVAVATSTDPANPNYPPSRWLAEEKWPPLWPVLADDADGTAAKAFGISGFPFLVLVAADGTVLWRHSGRITAEDLAAAVGALVG